MPFVGEMCRSKRTTARAIVRTCLQLQIVSGHRGKEMPKEGCTHFAETVMVRAPAFLLAVKLTMFKPHAMTPLTSRAMALDLVICVAP